MLNKKYIRLLGGLLNKKPKPIKDGVGRARKDSKIIFAYFNRYFNLQNAGIPVPRTL